MPSAPSDGVSRGPANTATTMGPNFLNYKQAPSVPGAKDVLPGMDITSTKTVPLDSNSNLKAPLGAKDIEFGINSNEMSKRTGIFHDAVQDATKNTESLMDPALVPFLDNSTAAAFSSVANSANMQKIFRDSLTKVGEVSGVNDELIKNAKNLGRPTGAQAKYAKSIKDSNKIQSASRKLVSANKNFYDIVESECPMFKENPICKDFEKLQYRLIDDDFETMIIKNFEFRNEINQNLEINDDRKLAILRMKELLADRLQELSSLEKKINKLDTDINVNSRKNYYKSIIKNDNQKIQSYIIFIYYEIFLVYLLISNLIPEKNYENIIILFLLILYLLFPILMSNLKILLQNLIIKLQNKLGIH